MAREWYLRFLGLCAYPLPLTHVCLPLPASRFPLANKALALIAAFAAVSLLFAGNGLSATTPPM